MKLPSTIEFQPREMRFLVEDSEREDDDRFLALPARYEVCPRCEGKGTHWHSAFDGGITQEDRDRDWDDESWAGLMSGRYDVECEECEGKRVVPVPVESRTTPEAEHAFQLYTSYLEDEADYAAERARERRMGC